MEVPYICFVQNIGFAHRYLTSDIFPNYLTGVAIEGAPSASYLHQDPYMRITTNYSHLLAYE